MATLKRLKYVNIGTSSVTLTLDGTPGGTNGPAASIVWNIPRLYLTNVTAGIVKVTVTHSTGATPCRLAFTRPVAIGDALVLENIVMLTGDYITVVADTVSGIDAFGSIDEEAA